MRGPIFRVLVLLLGFAAGLRLVGGATADTNSVAAGVAPLAPVPNPFADFENHLKAAIEKQDLAAIQSLYWTNGLSAEELNAEFARWRLALDEDAENRASIRMLIFRDFTKSNKMWEELAGKLTTHRATHLAQFWCRTRRLETWAYLPLVAVGDRMLIVPSDHNQAALGTSQPIGPVIRSPQIRSEGNPTSGAH